MVPTTIRYSITPISQFVMVMDLMICPLANQTPFIAAKMGLHELGFFWDRQHAQTG